MNMITPQNKSKSAGFIAILLTIIMIIGCFTTACQPTPEELVVQNKADDELQEAIAQTATPNPSASSEGNDPTQSPQSNEPIAYIEDVSSNASNTVTLEINAEVINNQPANIPVAKIAPYYFTETDVERMAKAFFGDTQFYEGTYIKNDYDILIVNLQYRISSDEELLKSDHATAGGITDLAELRAYYQKSLDRMIEDRNNAPDERQVVTTIQNTLPYALADLHNGYMGRISSWDESVVFTAFEDNELYPPSRSLANGGVPFMQLDINNPDTEYQNAKKMAEDMISEMDIDAVLGDAYLQDDPIAGSNRQYYVFCFEKMINDSKLDHTLASGMVSYSKSDDDVYEKLRAYESLEIWIEGDKLVQFAYYMPMQITEIINKNVALNIDYTKAIELAKQHAYVAYIDTYDYYSECKVTIDKIELVLARTKEANTGDYIVVPAWNFYGLRQSKLKVDDVDLKSGEWRTMNENYVLNSDYPLITVNALDGSIIDMAHGY